MTEEPCLRCNHPDHDDECGALMGTFYGDDGTAEDDRCDCTTAYATGGLISDAAVRGLPHYSLGGFLCSGRVWISNDSGEDEPVIEP